MPDLDFRVDAAEPQRHAAAPLLVFKLRIDQRAAPVPIHAIALRCQIRLEPGRRHYDDRQRAALLELFGPPSLWGQSLRPMLWTHATAIVPAFTPSTVADLPVPCTYDFSLAATKYFDALGDNGDIPLRLLFSGTIFYESSEGTLQTAPIPWDKEAAYKLPARVWRDLMHHYYPNTAWLALDKDVFDQLRHFKVRAGHMTFDRAMEDLLQSADQRVPR
jgi:hypothetical protein